MKIFLFFVVAAITGCTTAYAPNTLTGGYKEKKIDEDSYIVSFFGNGHTSQQQVWNYWIYRCAELTIENGYEFFSLEPSDKHALLKDPNRHRLVDFTMIDYPPKGKDVRLQNVQYYYYSVTTYSSKAVVNMYKTPISGELNINMLLDAQSILDQLKPYVEAKAKISPPNKKLLFIRASVEAAIKAKNLNPAEASKLRNVEI